MLRLELIDASVVDFHKLDGEDLRNTTLGVYQLKLTKSSNMEHQNENGQNDILINKQDRNLLMAKLKSRNVTVFVTN